MAEAIRVPPPTTPRPAPDIPPHKHEWRLLALSSGRSRAHFYCVFCLELRQKSVDWRP